MQNTPNGQPRRPQQTAQRRPAAQPAGTAQRSPAAQPAGAAQRRPAQPGARPAQPQRKTAQPARPQQRRRAVDDAPFREGKGGGGLKILLAIIGIVAVVAICFVAQFLIFPDGRMLVAKQDTESEAETVASISGSDQFQLSEVMTSNGGAIMDDELKYCDWVELTNGGNSTINLEGYVLAQSEDSTRQFTFPSMELKPGEYVLVFCDNYLSGSDASVLHAPFKLSSSGDTLMLFNPSGTCVESINIPSMNRNAVYCKDSSGAWSVTEAYTPNMANTLENHETLTSSVATVQSDVYVTEFMCANVSYAPDEDGDCGDWIEITNNGTETVNLEGYGLSDSRDKMVKWKFPAVKLGAGESMIIYCDGKDRRPTDGSPLHTNFSLAAEKESIVFCNKLGQCITCLDYDILGSDQSMSLQQDGSWTTSLAPTPGYSNTKESAALIDGQFAAQNTYGVFINEVMATTNKANCGKASYDWVELYNSSNSAVDLSGMGLSDSAGRPRKWQFPEGSTIQPGEYLVVYLSGLNSTKYKSGDLLHTNFSLSADGGEELVLSTADGKVFDRVFMPAQESNISYGRINGEQGFFYFTEFTAMAENSTKGYRGRAQVCNYSVPGGRFDAGSAFTVELSSPQGGRIYYTTDCSDPDEHSQLYSGPIAISGNTVLRTRVYDDNSLPSLIDSQTYLLGVSHTVEIVSLITDPDNLWDSNTGIFVQDAGSTQYTGWRSTEMPAYCQIFTTEGETIISQGCGIRLHGQYSRAEDQKALKVIARSEYGDNRFRAKLFDALDYTEYQSFILRSSGQDWDKTRMRDSILSALARNTDVLYQETTICVVYLNGEYWGEYNMRERINTHFICQHEGWEGDEDDLDLVKANSNAMQGSNETFASLLEWIAKNGIDTDEKLAYVDSVVDVDNYMQYVALQIFTGNTDLLNVKRYRNPNADGRWRWIVFDEDWAFYTDTNSPRRWLDPKGAGSGNKTNNKLWIALMKNKTFKDKYLTYMGKMLATDWSTQSVMADIQTRYEILTPEMPAQLARWNVSSSTWNSEMKKFIKYAEERPSKLMEYMQSAYELSDSEMQHYFGDAMTKINEYAASKSAAGEGGE